MKNNVVDTLSAKHSEIKTSLEDNQKKHDEICKNIQLLEENKTKINEVILVMKGMIDALQYSIIQCAETVEEKKDEVPKIEAKKGK
jgi:chromosome segregation ATPase